MMTNREYTALVDAGKFPEDPAVPIDGPFVNGAGCIYNLVTEKFTHVALIKSQAGAVRANHYHKTDWHYAYVVSGGIEYYWRPVGSKDKPRNAYFGPGTMFFSPPMVEHAMFFQQDTVFLTFAKNERSVHETHEADLVRVPLVRAKWSEKMGFWLSEVVAEVEGEG